MALAGGLVFLTACSETSSESSAPSASDPFVIAATGQSNACGWNRDATGEGVVDEDVQVFVDGAFQPSQVDRRPYGNGFEHTNNMIHWFGMRVHEETGRPVYILFNCKHATAIDQWAEGGTMYLEHVELIEAGLHSLNEDKIDVLFWGQGERDKRRPVVDYSNDFYAVVDQYRSNSWASPELPILVMEFAEDSIGNRMNALHSFHDQNDDQIWTIHSAGLDVDTSRNHFTGESLQTMGYERMWDAWVLAQSDMPDEQILAAISN